MKRVFVIAIAATLLTACCNSNQSAAVDAENPMNLRADGKWEKIDAKELNLNIDKYVSKAMALTVSSGDSVNTMAIGWLQTGRVWNLSTATVYVRTSRYTYDYIQKADKFVISALPDECHGKVMYIGSKSGRDEDKITNAGLTIERLEDGQAAFTDDILRIECRKIFTQLLDTANFVDKGLGESMYATEAPHYEFIGEITNVWVRR